MKKIIALILGFSCTAVNAQDVVHNDCTNLFSVADWSQLSVPVTLCLNADSNFVAGISTLCQSDKTHLSNSYTRYLDLEKKYQEAAAAVEASTDPSAEDQIRLEQARQDWELLGHREEVETKIGEVQQRYDFCSRN